MNWRPGRGGEAEPTEKPPPNDEPATAAPSAKWAKPAPKLGAAAGAGAADAAAGGTRMRPGECTKPNGTGCIAGPAPAAAAPPGPNGAPGPKPKAEPGGKNWKKGEVRPPGAAAAPAAGPAENGDDEAPNAEPEPNEGAADC